MAKATTSDHKAVLSGAWAQQEGAIHWLVGFCIPLQNMLVGKRGRCIPWDQRPLWGYMYQWDEMSQFIGKMNFFTVEEMSQVS
jgi:hypothetical protein